MLCFWSIINGIGSILVVMRKERELGQQIFRLLQITDTHIMADKKATLYGVNAWEPFVEIMTDIRQNVRAIDLIVLTGDLSHDNSTASYQYQADFYKQFAAPKIYIPGNHDDYDKMQRVFMSNAMTNERAMLLGQWQIISLNSQVPGSVPGRLSQQEMAWLQHRLSQYPDHLSIIFLHHPLFDLGVTWLDPLKLINHHEFLTCINAFPQVKAVFSGHVHQEFHCCHQQIDFFTTPSTCAQFAPAVHDFALEEIAPGYRIIDLHEHSIQTQVRRLVNKA